MTQLLSERRISLTALAKREGVAIPTIWRWRQKGIRGIRLESYLVGAKRFTTEESFIRFVERTTAAADGEQHPAAPRPETNRQAATRAARTDTGLAGHGV